MLSELYFSDINALRATLENALQPLSGSANN
jgi:hypothetical protein